MAVVVEDSTSASAAAAASITINTPTGCEAGEALVLIIAGFYSGDTPEADVPTDPGNMGWSYIGQVSTAGTSDAVDATAWAWARFATDAEPADVTFLLGGTEDWAAAMLRLSGVDLANITPQNELNTGTTANGNASMVAPTITVTAGLLVAVFASNGTGGAAASHSTPGGMTEAEEVAVDTSTLSVCTEVVGAGATGTRTSTRSTTNQRCVQMSIGIQAGDTAGELLLVGQAGAHRTTTGTTLAVTAPAGVADGDLLVAAIAVQSSTGGVWASLSGWTDPDPTHFGADSDDGAGNFVSTTMLYRTASSEGATWTFGWTGSNRAAASVVVIRNPGGVDAAQVASANGTDAFFAASKTTRPSSLYVMAAGVRGVVGSPMEALWIDNDGAELMHAAWTAGVDTTTVPMAGVVIGYGARSPLAFQAWPGSGPPRSIVAALEVYSITTPLPHARGILREAKMKGARLSQAGAVTPDITATLYDLPDLSTAIVALDQVQRVRWQEDVSEPGTGGFALQLTDPDVASFDADGSDLVTFRLRGWAALTMICEKYERQTIDPAEEADQKIEWTGRGHLALLERMVVYPWRGVARLPVEEDRAFNWSSPSYIDTWWPNATEMAAAQTGLWWGGLPPDWPGGAAGGSWIWASSGSDDWAPTGTCYFRKTFTLAADARLRIFLAIDDAGTLYFDGTPVISTSNIPGTDFDVNTPGGEPREIRDVVITATAGDHVIAVEGFNAPDDPAVGMHHNPGGILVGVWTTDGTGNLVTLVESTDASWLIVEYPPWPPGMTPGQVMRIVIEEGQARGVLPTLALGFTDTADSDGEPWPEVSDIATKVGTDTLTFFREMAGTYTDIWMAVGALRLEAWNIGGRGAVRAGALHPPTDVTDPSSGNLTALQHKGEV